MIFYLYILALISVAVYSQVLHSPRNQPDIISSELTSQCCGLDGEELHVCIKARQKEPPHVEQQSVGQVMILTLASDTSKSAASSTTETGFAIRGISEFRGYQSALLSTYAEHQGYILQLRDEDNSANYQPNDPRWNKMKLLLDAMESSSGVEFLLAMDSDAVVLDLGFTVQAAFEQYPGAQMLASADVKQGLLNSGVLLVRNSLFMRRFLRQWWGDAGDEEDAMFESLADTSGGRLRGQLCDQHAFDLLFQRYAQVENLVRHYRARRPDQGLPSTLFRLVHVLQTEAPQTHSADLPDVNALLELAECYTNLIGLWGASASARDGGVLSPTLRDALRVLPLAAVNSHPPAMFYQRPEAQFLHLMGEADGYRRRVFRRGWAAVCAHFNTSKSVSLPPQLGCDQVALLHEGGLEYSGGVENVLLDVEALMGKHTQASDAELDSESEGDLLALRTVVAAVRRLQGQAHHLCDILCFRAHTESQQGEARVQAQVTLSRSVRAEYYHQLRVRYHKVRGESSGYGTVGLGLRQWAHLEAAHGLRRRVFALLLEYRLHVRRRLETAIDRYSSDEQKQGQQQRQVSEKRRIVDMKYAYLSLIQLAAEAGNDWFASSWNHTEQIEIAATVQQSLLSEFVGMVRGASKAAPLHMRGLMHQNLAQVYYQQWLLRAEAGADTSTGDDEDLLKLAREQIDASLAALEEENQLNANATFITGAGVGSGAGAGAAVDVSPALEFLHSLLLQGIMKTTLTPLAGSRLSLSKLDVIWNLTIVRAHERLPHGVPSTNLLYRGEVVAGSAAVSIEGTAATSTLSLVMMTGVYYHAALSYANHAGGSGTTIDSSNSAGSCERNWELDVAAEYVQKALRYSTLVRLRDGIDSDTRDTDSGSGADNSPGRNVDLNPEMRVYPCPVHTMLSLDELHALRAHINHIRDGASRGCPSAHHMQETAVQDEDEDEWEECFPGEEDCQPFYEDEDEDGGEVEPLGLELAMEEVILVGLPLQRGALSLTPHSSAGIGVEAASEPVSVSDSAVPAGADHTDHHIGCGDEDEDEDEDELHEIQQRYKRRMEAQL